MARVKRRDSSWLYSYSRSDLCFQRVSITNLETLRKCLNDDRDPWTSNGFSNSNNPTRGIFMLQAIQNQTLSSQFLGILSGQKGSNASISAFPLHRSMSLAWTNSVFMMSLYPR